MRRSVILNYISGSESNVITDLNRSESYKDIFYHQYETSGRKKGSFLLVNTVRSPLNGKENEAVLFFCSVIC
jgi:hypothetical protein